jgi:hypothetical protein
VCWENTAPDCKPGGRALGMVDSQILGGHVGWHLSGHDACKKPVREGAKNMTKRREGQRDGRVGLAVFWCQSVTSFACCEAALAWLIGGGHCG